MNGVLTLEKVLGLPNEILLLSEKYHNSLLSQGTIDNYNIDVILVNLEKQLYPIKQFLNGEYLKTNKRIVSGSEKDHYIIDKRINDIIINQTQLMNLYLKLISVAIHLTKEEAEFLINNFLINEVSISDKYKFNIAEKSALVKLWINFKDNLLD